MPSTNSIEEKKNASNPKPQDTITSWMMFLKAIAQFILLILISMFFGSAVLYCCKVATSNILPTEVDCTPYANNDPYITPIDIDININKINDKYYSTKINFPFNKSENIDVNKAAEFNKSNVILEYLRKQKEVYNSWGIKLYFLSVIEGIFLKSYSVINMIFQFMNKNMYEFLTIILGPWILLFLTPIIIFFLSLYSFYLWFAEFHWLFKENKNTKEGYYPAWESVTFHDAYKFCISSILAIVIMIFVCVMCTLGFVAVTGGVGLIFALCLISTILMKSLISDGANMMEPYGVIKTLKDLLFSKLNLVMIIIILIIIIFAFTYLGTIWNVLPWGVVAAIVGFVLIYGLVKNMIYHREVPKDSTAGLVNQQADQAKKICKKITDNIQTGGAQLLSSLKKINKQMQEN